MKRLVIKSASLERLESFLRNVADNPDILAHESSAQSIKANYSDCRLIEYPYGKNFIKATVNRLVSEGKIEKNYDKVIVLASNLGGGGHHNVIDAAFTLGKKVDIYNINGELINMDADVAKKERYRRMLLLPVAISATLLISMLGSIFLISAFLKNLGSAGRNEAGAHGE